MDTENTMVMKVGSGMVWVASLMLLLQGCTPALQPSTEETNEPSVSVQSPPIEAVPACLPDSMMEHRLSISFPEYICAIDYACTIRRGKLGYNNRPFLLNLLENGLRGEEYAKELHRFYMMASFLKIQFMAVSGNKIIDLFEEEIYSKPAQEVPLYQHKVFLGIAAEYRDLWLDARPWRKQLPPTELTVSDYIRGEGTITDLYWSFDASALAIIDAALNNIEELNTEEVWRLFWAIQLGRCHYSAYFEHRDLHLVFGQRLCPEATQN